jgi:hypothetical protein
VSCEWPYQVNSREIRLWTWNLLWAWQNAAEV